MNPEQKLTCRSPRNHVRVLDRTGSDVAHVARTLLIDGTAVPFDYLSVFSTPEGATELRVRVPREVVTVHRDDSHKPKAVFLRRDSILGEDDRVGVSVLVAQHGLELVEDSDGKRWADLTLLPTTVRFDRDEA
ncbi:MAG: hypothetical protein QJR09_11945 [Micrococcus sp.]|nr:hypothetical protein [Micrococcus sp.]